MFSLTGFLKHFLERALLKRDAGVESLRQWALCVQKQTASKSNSDRPDLDGRDLG